MILAIFAWFLCLVFIGGFLYYCLLAYQLIDHFDQIEERAKRDIRQAQKKMVELQALNSRIFLLTNH